jgi:uncharacterized protein (TIGR04255 family)
MEPLPLPEYDAPPVSEVALSIEFLPLANWRGPHAGRFWNQISTLYPKTEEMPPLPSEIERFGPDISRFQALVPRFQLMDAQAQRFWFIADPATRLIQVQRDRFIINWRKITGDETYPRYEKEMRPRFEREWMLFQTFVLESDLGQIDVQQCEVTYVNHIVKGEGWETPSEAVSIFSHWSGSGSDGFLPPFESLNANGTFLIEQDKGRLYFFIHRVIRTIDQKEAIQVQLTARGRPSTSSNADVLAWMDLGREWIVRGFTDLTTPRAHSLWKRRTK